MFPACEVPSDQCQTAHRFAWGVTTAAEVDLNTRLEFSLVPPLFLFHLVNYFLVSDLKPFHLPGILKPEKRSAISLLPQHLWVRQKKLPKHTSKLFIR